MRKLAIGVVVLLFLCVCMVPAALADDTSLQSSLIVINGTPYADTLSVPGVISSSGFGATTSPYGGTSVYGAVTVTLTNSGSSAENVSVDGFFDDELSVPFWNEYATVNGTAGCGAGCTQNYEVGDPIFSNIVNDTASDTLSNSNGIPQGSDNFGLTCTSSCNGDVSFAMGFDFTIQAGQTDTVEFLISTSNPGGFNIEQTHPVDGANTSAVNAFFSGSVTPGAVGPPPPPGMPEPGTIFMLGSSFVGLIGLRKKLF